MSWWDDIAQTWTQAFSDQAGSSPTDNIPVLGGALDWLQAQPQDFADLLGLIPQGFNALEGMAAQSFQQTLMTSLQKMSPTDRAKALTRLKQMQQQLNEAPGMGGSPAPAPKPGAPVGTQTNTGQNLLGQINAAGGGAGGTGGPAAALTGGAWDIVRQVATEMGVDPNLAVSIAFHESGGNPQAMGDYENGAATSYGLFQLHRGGELGSLTMEQAFDPATNARVALAEVARVVAQHPDWSPGQIAYAAQRPSAKIKDSYIASIDAEYGGTHVTATGATDLSAPFGTSPVVTSDYHSIMPADPAMKYYTMIQSAWMRQYGVQPPLYAVQQAQELGFQNEAQVTDWLNNLPSEITTSGGAMTMGQRLDFENNVQNAANKYMGYPVPASFLQQLASEGYTDPIMIDAYFKSHPASQIPRSDMGAMQQAALDHPMGDGTTLGPDQAAALYKQIIPEAYGGAGKSGGV